MSNTKNYFLSAKPKENNWAFIDEQNLYKGIKEKGWRMDWRLFRDYLTESHNVSTAIVFMGYIASNQWMYRSMEMAGFELEFRTVRSLPNGVIDGGNIDTDLVCCLMDYKNEYAQAVLVADDGDYHKAVQRLQMQNKLRVVISSHVIKKTSGIIRSAVGHDQIISIHSLRQCLERRIAA